MDKEIREILENGLFLSHEYGYAFIEGQGEITDKLTALFESEHKKRLGELWEKINDVNNMKGKLAGNLRMRELEQLFINAGMEGK